MDELLPISGKCLDSPVHKKWDNTLSTLASISFLSCVRMYNDHGCQGSYFEHSSRSHGLENLKNIRSITACPLSNVKSLRVRRSENKEEKKEEKEEEKNEEKTEVTQDEKKMEPKGRRVRFDYPGLKAIFEFNFPHLLSQFRKHITKRFEKKDDWTFFLGKGIKDHQVQYKEALKKIIEHYEARTKEVISKNITDIKIQQEYFIVILDSIMLKKRMDKHLNGKKDLFKSEILTVLNKPPAPHPWTFEALELWTQLIRLLRTGTDVLAPDSYIPDDMIN